jgi:hypothetical protein
MCPSQVSSNCRRYLECRSSQVGRHHEFAVARLNCAMAVQHLNCSVAAWYVLDQASVVCAIPGVALSLKRPANSVAILEYSVAHDVFLHGQRLEYVSKSSERGPAKRRASTSITSAAGCLCGHDHFVDLHSASVAGRFLHVPCPLRDRLCRGVHPQPGETLRHDREVQRL